MPSNFFLEFKAKITNSKTKKSLPQQSFSLKSGFLNVKPSSNKQLFERSRNESDDETDSGRFHSKINDERVKIIIF